MDFFRRRTRKYTCRIGGGGSRRAGTHRERSRVGAETQSAVAVFQGLVKGEVIVQPSAQGVKLKAHFFDLPPGKHGFHIHTAGDLRGEGCKGACDHFHVGLPKPYGGDPSNGGHRHTGDLGNVELEEGQDEKTYIYTLRGISVKDLWGRSIIVHADEDDLGKGPHEDSKTTGHSGARIACAIFGRGSSCSE